MPDSTPIYGGVEAELTLHPSDAYKFRLEDDQENVVWLLADDAVGIARAILAAENETLTGDNVNEALLATAARYNSTVRFRYAKGNGDVIETRLFQPEKIDTYADHKTVVGFDPERDDVRAFRLDRIKGQVAVA
jgi:predicted DNA-binding transcriptional regulator YafY